MFGRTGRNLIRCFAQIRARLRRRIGAPLLLVSLALTIIGATASSCKVVLSCQYAWTDPHYHTCIGFASDLSKDGTWFRDSANRYVLFRGVNFGPRSKLPPYVPVLPLNVTDLGQVDKALESELPQLQYLAQLGVNVVRLPIMWERLEPHPNPDLNTLEPAGTAYLDAISKIITTLYANFGIFVIVDFHQDIASEVYSGDGFPSWALAIDGRHPCPTALDSFGHCSTPRASDDKWGLSYYDQGSTITSPIAYDVRNTLHGFWQDYVPNNTWPPYEFHPQTHLVKTIGQVAKYFSDNKVNELILGYEPFNEPFPAGYGSQDFESRVLYNYYTNVLSEIRKYDQTTFLFVEPRMDWTTYPSNSNPGDTVTSPLAVSFTKDPQTFLQAPTDQQDRVVFSFHYYDPTIAAYYGGCPSSLLAVCDINMQDKAASYPRTFAEMQAAASSRDLIPFMTEFGCENGWTDDPKLSGYRSVTEACMDLQFQQVEDQLLNETYWAFDLFSSADHYDNWNGENYSLLVPGQLPGGQMPNAFLAARPYPMRSSGIPQHVCFDVFSKNAAIVIGQVESEQPTVIWVPRELQYGDNFEVRISSGQIKWDEKPHLLYWQPDKQATSSVLVLSQIGGFDSSKLRCLAGEHYALSPSPLVTGKDHDLQLLP